MRVIFSAICLVAGLLAAFHAGAGEVCRFSGTTDYSGRLAVTTKADTDRSGVTTVDVLGAFTGTPSLFVHVRYLMEEISTFKSGQLQTVAVNTRYLVDGRIVRQLWDVFERGKDGLEGYRIEGSPADMRRQHPGFVGHWDPATFGQAWLEDFWAAHPDRRRDLDLPADAVRPNLRSPLALAFYWSRWVPRGGETVSVFMPGYKRDKSVTLTITAGPPGDGWQRWQTTVRYPGLSLAHPSTAAAWVSPDDHLLQLAGTVETRSRTGSGIIRQEGCTGNAG